MAEMNPYEYEHWKETVDWEEYIQYAEENGYDWKDIKWLNPMLSRKPSWKQIRAAKNVIDKIDKVRENEEFNESYTSDEFKSDTKHLTVRVAWHDNKWNGCICKEPAENIYCNGYKSLLSERLRKRKDVEIECNPDHVGQSIDKVFEETGYIPPCFWSINAFSDKSYTIEHDNPAEPALKNIPEALPSHSIFSWPFAVSFNRDPKLESIEGAYPRGLEEIRIPNFQSKLKENESLVFLYANYDNPISGEDQEYLVVGVGLLKEKGEATRFNGQDEIFKKKIEHKFPKNKNFPRVNWALRYSLDWPKNCVRIPYHEYLEEADKTKNYEVLERIKVSISEPELIHNFKYVAMDIDDDACIYLLTKMRQKLVQIRNDGIVPLDQINSDLKKIERFLGMSWDKRGYFPGLNSLAKAVLPHLEDDIDFTSIRKEILEFEEDQIDAFKEILNDPFSNPDCKSLSNILEELKSAIEQNFDLSLDDFLRLAMLNLNTFQFHRIINGKIIEKNYTSPNKICNNPYLLFEEYEAVDEIDPRFGDSVDYPIELFKIDIAFFPHSKYLTRLPFQKQFTNTDKRRIRALIIQHLRSLESFGHCFDEAREIEKALANYPLFYKTDQEYQIPETFLYKIDTDYESHLIEKLEIVEENDKKYFYLDDLYSAEQFISNTIKELLDKEELDDEYHDLETYLTNSVDYLKDKISNFDNDLFIDERTKLYENIFRKRFYVIAGSPGSGKSHELLKIVSHLKNRKEKENSLILAPTGKAVLRLSKDDEFDNIEAYTIDKYLNLHKYKPETRAKVYHNIIIDEMSMVDLLKLDELLKCFNFEKPSFRRLIFVGDPYQLPPIGFGKVFIDTIEFLKSNKEYLDSFIQLESNCRQEMEPEILDFSKIYSNLNIISDDIERKVSNGGVISKNGGFTVHYWEEETQLYEEIVKRLVELGESALSANEILNSLLGLNEKGQIKDKKNIKFSVDGFQILSPYRTGNGGSGKVNTYFQEDVRKGKFLKADKLAFKNTDKVIQNSNVYEKGHLVLSNGSMGLAYDLNKYSIIFPENDYKPLSFFDSKIKQENLELAYCITVHKSQGSGFDNVFVILPDRLTLLSKELFYTALTRSKKSLSIFVQGQAGDPFSESLFEKIRLRPYTETRKTSLLNLPFWDYSLEPEKGVKVQSRVEYIIYKKLLETKSKLPKFHFEYEQKPYVNGETLKMKTDFTITTPKGNTFYWEHLGLLGNAYYENKWQFKRTKYQEAGIEEILITTDERHGIFEDKIEEIIQILIENDISTEDKYNQYSIHHYYLR
jgi:exodeoxyribonuclease V alpha subunit